MLRSRRSVLLLAGILGLSLLSCGREVTGPENGLSFGRDRIAALALAPEFPRIPGANAISDLVPFERVRITLRRVDATIAKDTMVDFPSAADSISLAIDVPLPITAPDSGLTLGLSLAYINAAGDTVFRGGPLPITARPRSDGTSQPIAIPVTWVPPGGIVPASVVLTPATGTAVAGTTTTFTAVARDGQGQPIAGTPIFFSSEDTLRARVESVGSGLVTWLGVRGTTRIIATLPNGPADTSSFDISLPASLLLSVAGDAQSATINTALAQPLSFRVVASDSVPVAGVPVTFAVTAGGGALGALADTSDATGLVSTTWTLGALVGAQTVTATVTGVPAASRVVTATGLAPVPTQLAITAAPTAAVAGATFTPVTVEVRDADGVLTPLFAGPVAVALDTATAAGATLGGTTTVNAVAGVATFADLSITRASTGLSLIVTSAGLAADTSATLDITTAPAAQLASLSGGGQSGAVLTALAAPFVVRVTDAFGNPVAGTTVDWAVTGGVGTVSAPSTTTNAAGEASTTLTLGGTIGSVTVSATAAGLAGSPVLFTATSTAGAPAQLFFSQSITSATAGSVNEWIVQVRDAAGNVATDFNGSVSVALIDGPPTAVLGGTTTVNAVNGFANFNTLTVDLVATTYRLVASSAGLPDAQSAVLTITPAAPATLALVSGDGQSAVISAALGLPFIVRVTDAFTNPVPGVTVNWAILAGGGALSAPTAVTDALGNASISLTTGATAGTSTVTATVAGLAGSPVTFTTTVNAGAAATLAITSGLIGPQVAGVPLANVLVEARDSGGNLAPSFTGQVIARAEQGGVTVDSAQAVAVAGVATFIGALFESAGTYSIRFSAAGLADAQSDTFVVAPAAPAVMTLLAGDAQTGVVSTALADSVAFRITDAFGNPVPNTGWTIAVISGGGTASPAGGNADAAGEFRTSWTLGAALGAQGINAFVTAQPTVLASATATAVPGAATQLVITSAPYGTLTAGVPAPDLVVEARDAAGNLVTTFTGDVVGRQNTGPIVGNDSAVVAAVGGVATFVAPVYDRAGTYTFIFTAAGLADVITPAFDVVAGPAAAISPDTLASGDGQSGTVGQPLAQPLRALVQDAFGNPVAGTSVTFTGVRGVDTLSVNTVVSDAIGVASFIPTLPLTPGTVTYFVTSDGLTGSGFPYVATAEAGAATQLVITQQPANTTSGSAIPATVVEARDAQGNVAAAFAGVIEAVVDSGPVLGWSLGGTQTVNATAGTATFADLTLDRASQYRLRFRSAGLDSAVSAPFVVDAGAAASLTVVEGDAQSAPASQALADSLGARLTDAFGNPIVGVAVLWSVTSGGGAVDPGTSTTGVDGIARAAWTLGATAGTQGAQAVAAGFTAAFTANATPTDANVVWTGAVNSNWSEPGNWSGGAAPAAGDSVRIGNVGNQPLLDVQGFVARLRIESGATLQLDTLPVFISGTLEVDAGATVLSDTLGAFVLVGTGTVRGAMPRLYVQAGPYALAGALDVGEDLAIINGALAIGNEAATVGGIFSTTGSGTFSMLGTGSLTVQGDALLAGGSTVGLLTNGTMSVRGDFTQAGGAAAAFSASAGHTVVLDGPAAQTVTLLNADADFTPTCAASCFGTLRSLRGAGTGPLQVGSDLKALGTIDVSGEGLDATGFTLVSAGTPSLAADVVTAARVGWQDALVRTGGSFLVDTLVAWGAGPLIVGETVPTVVLGAHSVSGAHPAGISVEGAGVLTVDGTALVGSGTGTALRTRGNGRVLMQEATDTLDVSGDADFGGATTAGTMNAGLLGIGANFVMSNATDDAFIAEGTHTLRFTGANPTASFTRLGGNRIANLEVATTGPMTFGTLADVTGSVTVGPTTSVVGGGIVRIGANLIDTIPGRWQVTETFFAGADPVIPAAFLGSVVFEQGVVLDTALTAGGALEIRGGTLDLNGQRVEAGSFEARDTGLLRMASTADTLIVLGTARFRGASTAGQLMAGVLEVHGNFEQLTVADAFAASGTHQTWFVGGAAQTVSFANPGTGAAASHFAALGNGQTVLGSSVQLLTDAFADGMLLVPSSPAGTFAGSGPQLLTTQGADVRGAVFSGARWALVDGGPVNVIDTVLFEAQDPAAIQLAITRSGGTVGLGNPTFTTAPDGGLYLRAEDPDAEVGGSLVVAVTNPSPAEHAGGAVAIAPATITGWTDFAGLEWTGAVDGDWFNVANWAQGRLPTTADSVHIGPEGVTNLPALSAGVLVRALVNENVGPMTLGAGVVFSVRDRLVLRADVAGVSCPSGFVDVGAGGGTAAIMSGRVDCNVRAAASGTVTLDGAMIVGGGFGLSTQGAASLVVNGQALTVDGNLETFASSRLVMTSATDSVTVGNAYFGGAATTGALTAGVLRVRGNLDADITPGSFDASGTHVTRMIQGIGDTVSVTANAGPILMQDLDVWRPVRLIGATTTRGTVRVDSATAVVGTGRLVVGTTLSSTLGTLVAPNAVQLDGVLNTVGAFRPDTTIFNGLVQDVPFIIGGTVPQYQHVRITGTPGISFTGVVDSIAGDLIVEGTLSAAAVGVNGELRIGRDLITRNGGRLVMANGPHTVTAYRHALFDGGAAPGDLSAGTLRVHGDFTQLASGQPDNFVPGPAFTVAFDSSGTVSFADAVQSRFSRLEVNASGAVRTLLTDIAVADELVLNADGGGTLQSNVLGTGGTRLLSANGLTQGGQMTFRNVALRVQGTGAVSTTTTLSFADFDATAVQLEIAREAGTITLFDPIFSSAPTGAGRYLRVVDTNVGDADDLTVIVDGTPTPAFHGGFAEAVAPAVLSGWGETPNFTWTGGGTTSDWNTAANWAGGVVPSPADSVFVPGALLYNPVIPAATTLRAFVSARTETPITTAGTFTVTGTLSVPTVGGLDCGINSLEFSNGVTSMSARGLVSCYTRLLDGTVATGDTLLIAGNDLQVEGSAILEAGPGLLQVGGQFGLIGATSLLRMLDDSAHVVALGGATFSGASSAGQLTAGLLEIHGNFTQNGSAESFAASGTHVTAFVGNVVQQVEFLNPGQAPGTSHFANIALGQTEGGVSVRLNSDAYAIGQLRDGVGSVRTISAGVGGAFFSGGANVTAATFDGVRWELLDGATVESLVGVTFTNMPTEVPQFSVTRTSGVVAATNFTFVTPPSAGVYVRADDPDGAANGSLVVSMSGTSPAGHGGAIAEVNTATIVGWAANPPLAWTGGGADGNWSTAANWSLNRVPQPADTVQIDGNVTVDLSTTSTVAWINLGVTGTPTLNLNSGAVLDVTEGAMMSAGSTLTLNTGGTLTGSGSVVVGGTMNWTGGTMSGDGGTVLSAGSNATIAAAQLVALTDRTLVVGGNASIGAGGFLATNTPVVLVLDTGILDFPATADFFSIVSLQNQGTVRKLASAGTVRLDWIIANTASIVVEDEVLDLRNTLTHASGTLTIAPGATVVHGGQLQAAGAIDIGDGGSLTLQSGGITTNNGFHTLEITSNVTGAGTLRIFNADTVTITGAVNVDSLVVGNSVALFQSTDTIRIANGAYLGGGFFSGSSTIAISGLFTVAAGNPNGTGTLFVRPGAELQTTAAVFRGWDIDVAGTWNWGDGDLSLTNDPLNATDFAVVNIQPGGVLSMNHGATARSLFGYAGVGIFNNGTLRKASGGATTQTFGGLQVANVGTIDVVSGGFTIQSGCTVAGTITGAGTFSGAGCGP